MVGQGGLVELGVREEIDLGTALRARTRPAVRPTLLRLRVLASFLRLLPVMLARRAGRRAVPRRELERWLVTSR